VKDRKALYLWLQNRANGISSTLPPRWNAWLPPHLNAENNHKISEMQANRSPQKVQSLHSVMCSPNSSHQGFFVIKGYQHANAQSSVKWTLGEIIALFPLQDGDGNQMCIAMILTLILYPRLHEDCDSAHSQLR
jgi:hypothetical protein